MKKHDYDGIEELDNMLPKWWVNLFLVTILFGVGYYFYYELAGGRTQKEELTANLSEIDSRAVLNKGAGPEFDETKLNAYVTASDKVSSGKSVFTTRCVSCHGAQGEGGIGPNLTDDYWINGDGKPLSIASVVKNGVAVKGMPPWGPVLSQEELYSVVAFVRSLHGTKPDHAKAPQGDKKS